MLRASRGKKCEPFRQTGLLTECLYLRIHRADPCLSAPDRVFCRYIVISGEVEVSEKRQTGNPDEPVEIMRLGFLSEGAFFGEAPLLGRKDTSLELRMRTVTAVRDGELCYLTRDAVAGLYQSYPELQARMVRFASSGRVLDER